MTSKHPLRRERGVAAVEFALVLPLLLILIFGLIDFGRLLSDQIQVSSAAREGVRMAALADPAGITTRVDATVPSSMATNLVITPGTPCPAGGSTDPSLGTAVTVAYPFHFITPLGPMVRAFIDSSSTLGGDITLSSTASMRCGG